MGWLVLGIEGRRFDVKIGLFLMTKSSERSLPLWLVCNSRSSISCPKKHPPFLLPPPPLLLTKTPTINLLFTTVV
jgi:hypothetical protein